MRMEEATVIFRTLVHQKNDTEKLMQIILDIEHCRFLIGERNEPSL